MRMVIRMGTYDMVIDKEKGIEIQIKLLDCDFKEYAVGDKIALPDGCYLGYGGYFVVKDGRILFVDNHLYDKYGGELDIEKIVDSVNPVALAVEKEKKKWNLKR